jgi:hypothetical protein
MVYPNKQFDPYGLVLSQGLTNNYINCCVQPSSNLLDLRFFDRLLPMIAFSSSPPEPKTPTPLVDHPAFRTPDWSASRPYPPAYARKSGPPGDLA